MLGYIQRILQRFHHLHPRKPQHSPQKWDQPIYGQKIQYAKDDHNLPILPPNKITRIQQIVGCFLFYARAIDSTMLVVLNTIGSEQSVATLTTQQSTAQLLDYASTHPNTIVCFHASDMCLYIDSDASYLAVRKARSRAGGYYYLSDKANSTKPPTKPTPNGVLHALCITLRNVMTSAAEAELGALFYNGQVPEPIRTCLEEMGYSQPSTPIKTDNSTAAGIVNSSIHQKNQKPWTCGFIG